MENYALQLKSEDGKIDEKITFEAGINDTIIKEEWRDDIVGNIFYPNKDGKYKESLTSLFFIKFKIFFFANRFQLFSNRAAFLLAM